MGLLDLIFGTKNHELRIELLEKELLENRKEKKRHVQRIDENISQNISFVPPNNFVTLFTFQVPSRAVLRLTKFANYTDTPAGLGSIIWRILRNGIGVIRYEAILDIIGMSYCPEGIEVEEFKGGDLLTINVTNGYTANLIMGVRVVLELGDN